MELEIGKKYRRIDGEVRTIVNYNRCPIYTFMDQYHEVYEKNGYHKTSHMYDLIEEVADNASHEICMGKKYRTRDGRSVEVIVIDKRLNMPVITIVDNEKHATHYSIEGYYNCFHEYGKHNNDLVEVNL